MRILVAPDSFKGSLDAATFCRIAEQVLRDCLPDAEILSLPLADGGEGTLDALVAGTGGQIHRAQVTGPLGAPITARWGLLGDGTTAIVEMAQASGLPLVPPARRNPLETTSYGTGELILHALNAGAQRVLLALGGSATNDGGMGALQALGFRFLDADGHSVPPTGAGLGEIQRIECQGRDPRLDRVPFLIASDVNNPLLGPRGATYTYGPQKGADAKTLEILEANLKHFADQTRAALGRDCRQVPGAGAAGGMGFGFLCYLRAELRSGFDLVAETYALPQRLAQETWDLLITGEGQLDGQSVQGKLVGRLAALGKAHGVPVLVLAGSLQDALEPLYDAGVTSAFSLLEAPLSLEAALAAAPDLLANRLRALCRLWLACVEKKHLPAAREPKEN